MGLRVRVRVRRCLQDGGGAVAAADYGVGVVLGERGEHLLDELQWVSIRVRVRVRVRRPVPTRAPARRAWRRPLGSPG